MATTGTQHFALTMPASKEHGWADVINTNWYLIDRYLSIGGNLRAYAQAAPNMTVRVDSGVAYVTGSHQPLVYAGGNSPSFSLPTGSGGRLDLLVLNGAGVLSIVQGTEQEMTGTAAANFPHPTFPTDKVPLCEVFLRATGATIRDFDFGSAHYILRDVRPFMRWD